MPIKRGDDLFCDSQNIDEDESYKVLTFEQAKELQAKMPQVPFRSILWIQFMVGMVVIFGAAFWGIQSIICAAAGVFSAWLPSAVFVWRVSAVSSSQHDAGFSLVNFYFWEAFKLIGTIALLAAAVLWIKPLIWQSLLIGFVVTIKAYGFACLVLMNKNKQTKSE